MLDRRTKRLIAGGLHEKRNPRRRRRDRERRPGAVRPAGEPSVAAQYVGISGRENRTGGIAEGSAAPGDSGRNELYGRGRRTGGAYRPRVRFRHRPPNDVLLPASFGDARSEGACGIRVAAAGRTGCPRMGAGRRAGGPEGHEAAAAFLTVADYSLK